MSQYRFLATGSISAEDLQRLITLTEDKVLNWSHSNQYYAFNAYPVSQKANDDPEVSEAIVGENLKGIRFGYKPETKMWHYLRLTEHDGSQHYVDEKSPDNLKSLVSQLYSHAVLQEALRMVIPEASSLSVKKDELISQV